MLDLALYDRIHLSRRPPAQRLMAELFLRFDYKKVDLVVEGFENLPDGPVIFAMNHTDNYNYWPFQYSLHKHHGAYMATWVKGKNYESPAVSAFLRWMNNIPIASRGYVITRDFVNVMGRRPNPEEYRELRSASDTLSCPDAAKVPQPIVGRARNILGHRFEPQQERYVDAIDSVMQKLMGRFIELNERAHALGTHLLAFPEGTRSVHLSRGHIGLAQVALHLKAPIVPVGCNGCDLVYTSRSVITKPGRIVYRIGKPMRDWGDLQPRERFEPFSRGAEEKYREQFQAIVDQVMDRINDLVDERHKYQADKASGGTRGTHRFM